MFNFYFLRFVRLCTWQSVICLFLACLVLWLYILPSAFFSVLCFTQETTTVSFYSRHYPPSQIQRLLELNEEIKVYYAGPWLVAGLVEDITFFLLILSFHIAFLNGSKEYQASLRSVQLVLVGFTTDVLQSLCMVCCLFLPSGKQPFLLLISLFFFIKTFAYVVSLITILKRKLFKHQAQDEDVNTC